MLRTCTTNEANVKTLKAFAHCSFDLDKKKIREYSKLGEKLIYKEKQKGCPLLDEINICPGLSVFSEWLWKGIFI